MKTAEIVSLRRVNPFTFNYGRTPSLLFSLYPRALARASSCRNPPVRIAAGPICICGGPFFRFGRRNVLAQQDQALHYQTGKNLLLCFCIRGNRVATCSRIVGSPGASIILIVPWRVGRQLAHFTMTPSLWHVLRLAIDFGTELKAANAEWSLHSLKKCFKIIQVRMSGRSAAW